MMQKKLTQKTYQNKLQNELDDSLFDDPFASKAKTAAHRDIHGYGGVYNSDFD